MFSSIFSVSSPDSGAPTFHPVTSAFTPDQFFGELEPKDTEWTCAGGFVTETQTFYNVLQNGKFITCQVIYSSIGVWIPTIQFTFHMYDQKTKERTWRSVSVSGFVTPPPPSGGVTYDKRSSKAKEFSIIHKDDDKADNAAESYQITANLGSDVQITLVVSRPSTVPGFKLGRGPEGGFSNFGSDPVKRDGYVVHRFWPRTVASGHIVYKGQAITVDGPGMFVHAIQGMRPNLVASRWNFGNFQSDEHGGVSAIQMEFTTPDQFGVKGAGSGGVKVNVGALVVGGNLVTVTGETTLPDDAVSEDVKSRVTHLHTEVDPETKYSPPSRLVFEWKGPVISDPKSAVSATLDVAVGSSASPKGLVQKVDVLAEIPRVVKAVINYVAGTKPYIYQWLNPATLVITAPVSLISGGNNSEIQTISVQGSLYNEATFIS